MPDAADFKVEIVNAGDPSADYKVAVVADQVVDLTNASDGDVITVQSDGTLAPEAAAGGVTDHGALTGLGDDDHAQYALADGSRGTFETAGAVATHSADSTNVHGIVDTAALVLTNDARLVDAAVRWIPAAAFGLALGSPVLDSIAAGWASGWFLDAASSEAISTYEASPNGWATVDVDLWWINAGAGAGDVRWSVYVENDSEGSSVEGTASVSTTATAAAENIITKTTIATGKTISAGGLVLITVYRLGAEAPDTLANDVVILGVKLRKAS